MVSRGGKRGSMWTDECVCDRLRVCVLESGSAWGQASSRPEDTQSSTERKGSLSPNDCLCTFMPISMCAYLYEYHWCVFLPQHSIISRENCAQRDVPLKRKLVEDWQQRHENQPPVSPVLSNHQFPSELPCAQYLYVQGQQLSAHAGKRNVIA